MAAVLAGWSTVMSNRSSGLRVPQPRRVPTGAACAPELHRESAENLAATSNQLPESLMFDFELGDETADFPPACKVHPDPERLQKALDEIRPYSRPRDTLEAKLLRDVQRLKRQVLQEEGRHDTVLLAAKLCGIGYRVTVREAVGGGQNCLSNLRHTFIYVDVGCDQHEDGRIIVEPQFREHFEISNSCPCYREMLDAAPAEFVGTRKSLFSLVALLCEEIAQEFQLRGMLVPPWRQMKGMLSKWFPANAKDTECEASPPTASSATDPSWMEKGCTKKSSNHVHPDNWIPFQYDRYY
mmetsp:Transcript_22246/g.56990  ORF Transcript_22246/g.56990 Transcript_22246/m.56990 type:complete len:297 (-) Transcript_22246:211-1101(-)